MNSRETAFMAAKAIDDKKGWNITILELKKVSLIADYFVLANGNSRIQTQAIADSIEEELKEAGISLIRREGYTAGTWILLDYGVIIVHIFQKEEREFYSLERLWGDAPNIPFQA